MTPAERRIEILRQQGRNVSWWDRITKNRPEDKGELKERQCGMLSVYLLEGGHAWTITRDGQKYLQYKPLNREEPTPVYFCAACRQRWETLGQAEAHYKKEVKRV